MIFIPFIGFSITTTPSMNYGKVLYNYSITLLDDTMKKNDAFVEEEDRGRFTSIYVETFLQSAKSVYTAKRHSNTLAEALPLLKNKVNICDLITITGIKIFYPKLYEVIKANSDVLTGPLSQTTSDKQNEQIKELSIKLDAIIDWYDEESDNGNSIRKMLILLFPRLNTVYGYILQTNENYVDCVGKKRICSDKHFELYFSVQYVTL